MISFVEVETIVYTGDLCTIYGLYIVWAIFGSCEVRGYINHEQEKILAF